MLVQQKDLDGTLCSQKSKGHIAQTLTQLYSFGRDNDVSVTNATRPSYHWWLISISFK